MNEEDRLACRLRKRDETAAKGIYEIRGALPFRTQIIVTSEWDQEDAEVHTWLRSLTNEGTQEELQGILKASQSLDDRNRKYADNVVDVFAGANRDLVRKSKEEKRMSAVINELRIICRRDSSRKKES